MIGCNSNNEDVTVTMKICTAPIFYVEWEYRALCKNTSNMHTPTPPPHTHTHTHKHTYTHTHKHTHHLKTTGIETAV